MRTVTIVFVVLAAVLFGCRAEQTDQAMAQPAASSVQTRTAVFAGGCFWCTESDFEKVPGVVEVVSGYTGGHVANPTYEEVSAGGTGHVEAVKVIYDPARVSYEQLLDWFWRHVDPTDAGGQFVDRGSQYRSVIFYADAGQRRLAEASKERLAASGRFKKPIVTEIVPLGPFYPAEKYHQGYARKNPVRYHWYRYFSERDQFLDKVWGKEKDVLPAQRPTGSDPAPAATGGQARYPVPTDAELHRLLTPLQYEVTREGATEPAFHNAYWNNHEAGIYVDVISGEPLFSSTDKFDSGTGWPSFTRPLVPGHIVEKKDLGLFMVRTEVRSRIAGAHLGHVFDDGPPPTGLRYCINSAALRFIPKADLERRGYGEYLKLFR